MAVTAPVAGFTDAAAGVPLVHVPPVLPLLLNMTVAPAHTDEEPLIVPGFGRGLTVTS